jgi:hypothetical protein
MPGYRELHAGQAVDMLWEAVAQDGYNFRATKVIVSESRNPSTTSSTSARPAGPAADGVGAEQRVIVQAGPRYLRLEHASR